MEIITILFNGSSAHILPGHKWNTAKRSGKIEGPILIQVKTYAESVNINEIMFAASIIEKNFDGDLEPNDSILQSIVYTHSRIRKH